MCIDSNNKVTLVIGVKGIESNNNILLSQVAYHEPVKYEQ